MPIVNKDPIAGSRNVKCKSCGNFLTYVYSETVYTCSVCGKQFDPREILSEILDKAPLKKVQQKTKTRKQQLKEDWSEILDYFKEESQV